MSTNIRGYKSRSTHYAPAKVARIAMHYIGISPDEMTSNLLFASMVYKREVVLYIMYTHTDLTYDQVASRFFMPPNAVKRLIMNCFYRLQAREQVTEQDIDLIKSQLNSNDND